ncbi:hypothetical protein BS78_06G244500 [Paspalum vaginatum]|nr:hypothetical protein BS78_06G244500 [Paspalum vaginatum]
MPTRHLPPPTWPALLRPGQHHIPEASRCWSRGWCSVPRSVPPSNSQPLEPASQRPDGGAAREPERAGAAPLRQQLRLLRLPGHTQPLLQVLPRQPPRHRRGPGGGDGHSGDGRAHHVVHVGRSGSDGRQGGGTSRKEIEPRVKQQEKKMATTLLSDVRPGVYNYVICVRVSRMWEFHGKNDDEPVKHLDLVLIDEKGTPMYAEIPSHSISTLKPLLKEKRIYYMRKIIIYKAKPSFKPVRSLYMIKLSKLT